MDELRRIIEPNNCQYISEVKGRWETFYSKVQFYGVMKKIMKPPRTLNGVEHAIAVFTALPLLFPSGSAVPKKVVQISEALFHVLTPSEDPDTFIHRRVLSSPVLLVGEENCMVVVGTTPVVTFEKDLLHEGLLYLLAYYYAFHLTYPRSLVLSRYDDFSLPRYLRRVSCVKPVLPVRPPPPYHPPPIILLRPCDLI
ncbi:hypothetical protein F2P79_010268 [Pimephales promelas]|nr:hypothetical protein F2P79_010268 [Pimephales promelas]